MIVTKRRWFRFSLGTLFFVVTVFAFWLGYELNWIRQRDAALNGWQHTAWTPHTLAKPPGMLWLFGEKGYGGLWRESRTTLSEDNEAQLAQVKRLFPEAKVVWVIAE